ncbi:MAG: UvrD-helicase domain-containing protein, partial [Sphingomonadales bacterium]|nr:UvrD-helicase domain-containing protein [Sphingomonadales bacterium]
NRYRYMMVDEYQDTNLAQYLWLRLLAQGSKNICCVGDDDQSIYGWRGAEVGNILKFEKDFPGAKIVRLEQNYRSTGHILGAASGVISANTGRLGKTLWTEGEMGEKVTVTGVWDSKEEARKVGEMVEDLQRHGNSLEEMAVLVRAGFQMREFEERFITLGLPYRVIGGPRFYERAEIRDALAYLRVINQPSDDLALERIINVPKRGIGGVTVKKIHTYARNQGIPMTRATRQLLETDDIGGKARSTLRALMDDFDRWRANIETASHVELAEQVLEESGYVEMWQNSTDPKAPTKLENLQELINAMGEFENLQGFLEHISLVMEATEEKGIDKISIMTLHGSKGLEYDTVFLPGWEESI